MPYSRTNLIIALFTCTLSTAQYGRSNYWKFHCYINSSESPDEFTTFQNVSYRIKGPMEWGQNCTNMSARKLSDLMQLTDLTIEFDQQNIPVLYEDSLDSQNHLLAVVIVNCSIKVINDGAVNLSVSELNLAGNKIERLSGKMFGKSANIHILTLSNNRIERIDPGSFDKFTSMVHINLSDNKLETIPDGIFSDISINVIDLSKNLIRNITPNTFRNVRGVYHLNLSNNEIISIISGAFDFVPESLHLEHNFLETIQSGTLANLNKCINLDLSFNKISQIEGGSFGNSSICSLNLSNNVLAEINATAFAGIKKKTLRAFRDSWFGPSNPFQSSDLQMEALDLSRNKIQQIHGEFEINAKHLNLSQNRLRAISPKTFKVRQLSHLTLSHNEIEVIERDLWKVCFVTDNFEGILSLDNNKLRTIENFNDLYLAEINLSDNNMTTITSETFFNTTVKVLRLDHNHLTTITKGMFVGLEAETIKLSHNKISIIESGGIDQILKRKSRLFDVWHLLLDNNKVESFNENCFNNSKLSTLNLQRNSLKSIQKGIFTSPTLRNLDLSSNNIHTIENAAFSALKLCKINLKYNRFTQITTQMFKGAEIEAIYPNNNSIAWIEPLSFQEVKNLQFLQLENNKLQVIYSGVIANPTLSKVVLRNNCLVYFEPGAFGLPFVNFKAVDKKTLYDEDSGRSVPGRQDIVNDYHVYYCFD